MSPNQELALSARTAIQSRRAAEAAFTREIMDALSFCVEVDDGKVAERPILREAEITLQINELDHLFKERCAVEPTPSIPPFAVHQEQPREEENEEGVEVERAREQITEDEGSTGNAHDHEKSHAQFAQRNDNDERAATSSQPQFTHRRWATPRRRRSPRSSAPR